MDQVTGIAYKGSKPIVLKINLIILVILNTRISVKIRLNANKTTFNADIVTGYCNCCVVSNLKL